MAPLTGTVRFSLTRKWGQSPKSGIRFFLGSLAGGFRRGRGGDDHLARTDHAIVQAIALLGDRDHGIRRMVGGGLLINGFVEMGIERGVQGLDLFAVMPLQDALQLLADEPETVEQSGVVGRIFRGRDRPLHVVQHGQQVAQQPQVRITQQFLQFPGGPLPIILQLGLQPQSPVPGLLQLGAGLRRVVGPRGAFPPLPAFPPVSPPGRLREPLRISGHWTVTIWESRICLPNGP